MEPDGLLPAAAVTPLSREEQANLELSRRRGKRLRSGGSDGEDMEVEGNSPVSQKPTEPGFNSQPPNPGKQQISYKDKLTNAQRSPEECKDWPMRKGMTNYCQKLITWRMRRRSYVKALMLPSPRRRNWNFGNPGARL